MLGCSAHARPAVGSPGLPDAQQIQLTVAEHIWHTARVRPACLIIETERPPVWVMRALAERGVRYSRRCSLNGTLVSVGAVEWQDHETANIRWERTVGPMGEGVSCLQRVHRTDGAWRLAKGCVRGSIVN
jgi:hypothetical protein